MSQMIFEKFKIYFISEMTESLVSNSSLSLVGNFQDSTQQIRQQVELAKQVDQTRQVNQTKQDEQTKQVEDLSESPLMLSDFMQPVGQLLSWGGKLMAGRKLSG